MPKLTARCNTATVCGIKCVGALDSVRVRLIRSVTPVANMLNRWSQSWSGRRGVDKVHLSRDRDNLAAGVKFVIILRAL